jgi:hypothetical protein
VAAFIARAEVAHRAVRSSREADASRCGPRWVKKHGWALALLFLVTQRWLVSGPISGAVKD